MLPESEAGRIDAQARAEPASAEESRLTEARRFGGRGLVESPTPPSSRLLSLSFLQALFFAYVMGMLAFLTFYVPPFQKADEAAHYQRAASITNLDFVCSRDDSGSYYALKRRDYEFPDLMHVWDLYIFRDVKFDRGWPDVDWSDPAFDEETAFRGYCDLPVLGYVPSALGVLIGKPLESPVPGFYVARALGAVLFFVALIIALRITPRQYRLLLYLYAGLPVVLHQVSAVSYDQVQLSLYPLIFAFITRFAVEDRPMRRLELAAFAALLIWAANVRLLTYTPLLLLFFAIRPRDIAPVFSDYLSRLGAFLGVGAALAVSHALLYLPRVAETSEEDQAHPWDQLDFILTHPGDFLAACYQTLREGEWLFKQFTAVFGWLEYGPSYFVFFAIVAVIGIVVYRAIEMDERRLGWPQIAGVLGPVALTVASLFVSLYMVWNPVGNDAVDGLQGRYFVGLVPIAVFGVSQVASRVGKRRFLHAGLVLATVILVYNIVRTIDLRYYG
jgi:uncharacterized membrane protein